MVLLLTDLLPAVLNTIIYAKQFIAKVIRFMQGLTK